MTNEQIKELSHYNASKLMADLILNQPEAEKSHAWAFGYLHAMIGEWAYDIPGLRERIDLEIGCRMHKQAQ